MAVSSVSPATLLQRRRHASVRKQRPQFGHTGARLQKSYYRRWVRNPQRIDRATKMPIYFEVGGKSPLTDFYEGDAEKQIEAIWQYVRLGDKMPPPVKAP